MNGFTQKTFASFLLVLILLIVNIQAAWRSQQIQLSPDQFSKLQGGSSFWKNPCTVDGFLFGISASGCMMGNIFACAVPIRLAPLAAR